MEQTREDTKNTHQVGDEDLRAHFERHVWVRDSRGLDLECDQRRARDERSWVLLGRNEHAITRAKLQEEEKKTCNHVSERRNNMCVRACGVRVRTPPLVKRRERNGTYVHRGDVS